MAIDPKAFALDNYLQDEKISAVVTTILEIIFSHLSPEDLRNVSLVSKIFNEIADKLKKSERYWSKVVGKNEKFWMEIVTDKYPKLSPVLQEKYPELAKGRDHREIFLTLLREEHKEKIKNQNLALSKFWGNPSEKKLQASLGRFSVLPKDVFLHILSFLSPFDLANIVRLSQFFAYMSENNILWKRFIENAILQEQADLSFKQMYEKENKLEPYLKEARRKFMKKYSINSYTINHRDDVKNLSTKLQDAMISGDDYWAHFKYETFNLLNLGLKKTTKDLRYILENQTRGIIQLLKITNVFIVLANQALLNSNGDIFRIFMNFVTEYAPEKFKELFSHAEYYYLLDRYLKCKEITPRAKADIQNEMFDSLLGGKNILLVEFMLAFHLDFLLEDQSDPILYTRLFPQPPLHHGVVSVHENVSNLFLPLIKLCENSFYHGDIFSKFIFSSDRKNYLEHRMPRILAQFSEEFIKNYRDSQGDTLLIMTLKSQCYTAAYILLYKCPGLATIMDARGKTPLLIACSHSSPDDLIALIKKSAELEAKNKKSDIPVEAVISEEKALGDITTEGTTSQSLRHP